MRILIATDAWHPQINGVVRTYERVAAEVPALGANISFLSPADFKSVACPFYPEIHFALPSARRIERHIARGEFDYVHVATEGPVGVMTRRACRRLGRAFTTSYHTRFPEYAHQLAGVPLSIGRYAMKRFHMTSAGTMVATRSMSRELRALGFRNLLTWTRGVDVELFRPRNSRLFGAGPVFLYAGRVSREKNIEAFLSLDLPGSKVVVGQGPHLPVLRARYPDATFTGSKSGEELADAFASADVFVFPSRTDTFGLVILEAMASGLPVAAFPVTGPIDLVTHGFDGALSEDLRSAAITALAIPAGGDNARSTSQRYSWRRTAELFLRNLAHAHRRPSVV